MNEIVLGEVILRERSHKSKFDNDNDKFDNDNGIQKLYNYSFVAFVLFPINARLAVISTSY